MSNTFEFAERFGFVSPLEDEVLEEIKHFWTGDIDFNKLVDKLNKGSFIYNGETNLLETKITKVALNKKLNDYFLGYSNAHPSSTWFTDKASTIKYKSQQKELIFDVFLSPYQGKTISKNRAVFSFNISLEKELFKYRVLFPFNSHNTDDKINEKYGIIIESNNYDELEIILKDLGISFDSTVKNKILNTFKNEFIKAGEDRNKIDAIYQFAPKFIIEARGKQIIVKDLKNILNGLVDETGTDEEIAVLNILTALNSLLKEKSNLKGNNDFLYTMINEKIGSESIFEVLYRKLNDYGGKDNFTKFIKMMYVFWANSSYKNEELYISNEDTGPNYLAYQNKQIFGFYSNGFKFTFIHKNKEPTIFVVRYKKHKHHPDIVGLYHIFQPVQLPEIEQKSNNLVLPSTRIPAFFLKAFDDKKAWDNFEKSAWLGLDVATTLTGVGNLLKFRHLLKLKRLNQAIQLKFALAAVEVTSGTLGTMLNFVNDCDPEAQQNNNGKKTFCQHLREFLILLDIATLSIDGIDSLLRAQARKTRETGYELSKKTKNTDRKKEINKIVDDLEEFNDISRKKVNLKNPEELGKLGKDGAPVRFKLIDNFGNEIGLLVRSTEKKSRTLIYKFIQNGKKIDIYSEVTLLNKELSVKYQVPVKKGEEILYADFTIPKNITDELSGFGKIMLDDGLAFYKNNIKFGKVDGNFGLWVKSEKLYGNYGGESINLTKFWEARKKGKNIEEAAFETFTGKWAKDNEFSTVWHDPINFPVTKELVLIKFLKQ